MTDHRSMAGIASLLACGALGCGGGDDQGRASRGVAFDSAEIEVIALDEIGLCESCDLGPVLGLRIGERSGPGEFTRPPVVAPDTGVFQPRIREPGEALPLLSLSTFEVVGEVPGAIVERADTAPLGRPVLRPGRSDRSIAVLWPDRMAVAEWTIEGELVRMIRGSPAGFPKLYAPPEQDGPPRSRLGTFAFDAGGRLWILSYVPADTWREHRAALEEYRDGSGSVGIPASVLNQFPRQVAPRLDVFDLGRGLHLGTWVYEGRMLRLLDHGGEVMAYAGELDDGLEPYLAVYRFELPEE